MADEPINVLDFEALAGYPIARRQPKEVRGV
jgi:hypothetical protein